MDKQIHHVAIICSDYEKSKEFYTSVLGGRILHECYRKERRSYKLDLLFNKIQIELFSFPNPPKRITNPEACGLRHIAFEMDNFDEYIINLNQKKIVLEPIKKDEITGKRFTFIKDPDDLPIELREK